MIIKNKIKFLIIFLIVYIVYLIHGLKNAGSNLLGVMFFEGFSAVIIKLILIVISCGLIYSILNRKRLLEKLLLPVYGLLLLNQVVIIVVSIFLKDEILRFFVDHMFIPLELSNAMPVFLAENVFLIGLFVLILGLGVRKN